MSIPGKATPRDLYWNIMGSAWESNSWWRQVKDDIAWDKVPDDWTVTGRVDDPNEPESEDTPTIEFEINATMLREALEKISADEEVRIEFRRKCLLLLLDPDNADFDAADGDYVIQIALFGKSVYA